MFPGAGARVYYNEAGEPIGWDDPSYDREAYYCDDCGSYHGEGCCYFDDDNDEGGE